VTDRQTDGQTDRISIANTRSQQYLPVQLRVKPFETYSVCCVVSATVVQQLDRNVLYAQTTNAAAVPANAPPSPRQQVQHVLFVFYLQAARNPAETFRNGFAVSASGGDPDPLAPGRRWGLRSQTPVIG